MKFSLNWLRDYVALEASSAEIARAITFLGFEVEQIVETGAPKLENVVVGEVLSREKHPNADKLSVCQVDIGHAGGVKTIVCGAQNYQVGDRVPVALPGAVLPGNFAIAQSKIRGQLSYGMMCSARELGLGEDSGGLLILADRPAVGTPIGAVLPPGDTVFDVEITPNRPGLPLAPRHRARTLGMVSHRPEVPARPPSRGSPAPRAGSSGPALPESRSRRPTTARSTAPTSISGVRIGPSPAWLQERLRAVGLRPINNVVDVGNYVMLEYGQPMHAFDARRLRGGGSSSGGPADGERISDARRPRPGPQRRHAGDRRRGASGRHSGHHGRRGLGGGRGHDGHRPGERRFQTAD